MVEKILWLIFAHFIGDWVLQSNWMSENKSKCLFVMFAHCMVWTACISVALEFTSCYALWKVLCLVFGHFVIDLFRLWVCWKSPSYSGWWLGVDQLCHIIQVIVIGMI